MEQAKRIQTSLLNSVERKALIALAKRQPHWMTSDILTFTGTLGALVFAAGFILSRYSIHWLWLSSFGMVINWYGDSLDGTLARFRSCTRKPMSRTTTFPSSAHPTWTGEASSTTTKTMPTSMMKGLPAATGISSCPNWRFARRLPWTMCPPSPGTNVSSSTWSDSRRRYCKDCLRLTFYYPSFTI